VKKSGLLTNMCEACYLASQKRERAERCEGWCQEYQSCNIEITGHAVGAEPSLISERPEEEVVIYDDN